VFDLVYLPDPAWFLGPPFATVGASATLLGLAPPSLVLDLNVSLAHAGLCRKAARGLHALAVRGPGF